MDRLAIYDDYWASAVHLVLNPELRWQQVRFRASDAFVRPASTSGWRHWRTAQPADAERADGYIVPGGWDHEHCAICDVPMRDGDRGYISADKHWVCRTCYRDWVAPIDLGFMFPDTRSRSTQ